ncbi:hypothetical protein [Arcobacter aquimarinus]|uniref:Uncharacterized protein n=1 Tax=Arcobacter aquimarinus TaxID=1315211 RepID=A0AAE7B5H0_9BACT|nr:hypothetical protein [Arcobacter aquimarinus]QKE26015.1 hypothetical protein AAQM_1264 [Arcobacter aquimarinus]RXI36617.1 hypothetical protein CP986_01330 [Arcobacter aquimarinus]
MITIINKESLYNLFGINNFSSLEGAIDSIAPSLVEYHLSSFCKYADEVYFNKRDAEQKVSIGDYNLYFDYNENIYLELESSNDELTQSFW